MSEAPARQRLDKWLWAARFFKTRSLATAAVAGGKVKLDGVPVKPAREVKPGDELEIAVGDQRWTVVVRGLNEQRRPAPEARLLYEETAQSLARRAEQMELKKLAPAPGAELRGRPTKRAGRMIRRFSDG
ncbi:RNA-binding S4 domain-containing protein [Sulfurisoma sediminicola]|uniref:Heat shock protein Hsp15 n=1 Tax=Sulfurisoma sediminicola TaxID=1381557 RepID=A0A497XDK6_9PROT|nr:RNA-binding S4 domain-containing protein [Sulfurisoma sediminicola]RLJ65092.1 heat shock protein Hsp15 [Sulfurisoma sediminicola]